MAIDELEVLLNLDLDPLEDDLEEAVDKFDRLDGRSTDNAQEELDDAADKADDLAESLDDADNQDVDVNVDDGEVSQLERRLEAFDGRNVEVDVDVDRERLRNALDPVSGGGIVGGGGSDGGRRDRVRLPGELDEVAEAGRAFSRLPAAAQGLAGSLAAATAALGAAGGLAGAATALATQLGDADLRQDLQKLKQRFRSLGETFVDAFEPIIRNTVIPAGVALAEELRSVIPELKSFTETNLPTLVGAVKGLVQAILGTAQAFGLVARTLGILTSAVQALVNAFGAQQGFSGQAIQENVQSEFVDILQGFGFGGQEIGVSGASFQVPQTEVQDIVDQIESGALSIGPPSETSTDGPGSRPFFARGSGDPPASEDLRKIQRQIGVARKKFNQLESFTRKDLQQALVDLRKKGVEALLAVEQKTGQAQDRTQKWIDKLQTARKELEEASSTSLDELPAPGDAEQVETAGPTQAETSPASEVPDRVSGTQGGGGRSLAERARTIRRSMSQVRRQIRQNVLVMGTFEQVGTRALARLGQGLGQVVAGIVTLQSGISSVGDAFRSLGKAALQVLQQVIAKLASAAALAAVLGPILGVSSASFGSIFKASLSGQAIPLASGGIVTGPTLAMVGEGGESEAVMPLSKLDSMIGAGGTNVNVNITGKTRTAGNDLVTTYDTTKRIQRRKGRKR
jgi:hypothetical protein